MKLTEKRYHWNICSGHITPLSTEKLYTVAKRPLARTVTVTTRKYFLIFVIRQWFYSGQNCMRTENSAPRVWTETPGVRHWNPLRIVSSWLTCQSHWKCLGDHGNRKTLLHLLQKGEVRDNAPSDRQYSPYTWLSVEWTADVLFLTLLSTCWSNANFMMKGDTDFICSVLCQTFKSINPAAYLLFWQLVTVSGWRCPLILLYPYVIITFYFPLRRNVCIMASEGNYANSLYSVVSF